MDRYYNSCRICSNKTMSINEDICWACQQKNKPLNTDEELFNHLVQQERIQKAVFVAAIVIIVLGIICGLGQI